jgi:hypothetical protein
MKKKKKPPSNIKQTALLLIYLIFTIINFLLVPELENHCFDFSKSKISVFFIAQEPKAIKLLRDNDLYDFQKIREHTIDMIKNISKNKLSHFEEPDWFSSNNWYDITKMKEVIDTSELWKVIEYFFVKFTNYPSYNPTEFNKLKWPLNRLIPMMQELTVEIQKYTIADADVVYPSDLFKNTIYNGPVLGNMQQGGFNLFNKLNKKTFKKKQLIKKKTHKKLLNY